VGQVYAADWRRAAVLEFVIPGFESMRVQPRLWLLLGGSVDLCDGVVGGMVPHGRGEVYDSCEEQPQMSGMH
jgi:hypothetical protein